MNSPTDSPAASAVSLTSDHNHSNGPRGDGSPLIFVHGSMGLGGAEVLRRSILREFVRQGIPTRVCILRQAGELAEPIRELGIPVDVLACRGGLLDATGVLRLTRYLKRHRPTIVQSSQFLTNLHTRIATRLARIPITIIEEHGLYTWKRWRHRMLDRHVCGKADAVLACSHSVANFAQENLRVADDRMHVIHNCVDHEYLEPACGDSGEARQELAANSSFVVGTVGTLRWEKGHRYLLDAWKQLRTAGTLPADAQLWVIGSGPLERALQEQAYGLPNVRFLGARTDTARLLRAMDLFMLPSVNEGFGIAIAEAMCAGVPVIATTSGGIPEVVTHQRTGLLVPPGESQAVAGAIERMYRDVGLRERLAAAAHDDAVLRFHPRQYVAQLCELYALLLEDKGLEVPAGFLPDRARCPTVACTRS